MLRVLTCTENDNIHLSFYAIKNERCLWGPEVQIQGYTTCFFRLPWKCFCSKWENFIIIFKHENKFLKKSKILVAKFLYVVLYSRFLSPTSNYSQRCKMQIGNVFPSANNWTLHFMVDYSAPCCTPQVQKERRLNCRREKCSPSAHASARRCGLHNWISLFIWQ